MPEAVDQATLMQLLGLLSELSTPAIFVIFAVHLFAYVVIWLWWRSHLRVLASTLDDFTRGLHHRSVLDSSGHPSEQIDAFLADVKDVMASPKDSPDRAILQTRIRLFDEKRRYLSSVSFDTCYNICKTMIESYPMFGILGTLLAFGVGLASRGDGNTAGVANMLVGRLGEAIWSTVAGLVAAVILMLINSVVEPRFQRLHDNRQAIREAVHHVKRELSTSGAGA